MRIAGIGHSRCTYTQILRKSMIFFFDGRKIASCTGSHTMMGWYVVGAATDLASISCSKGSQADELMSMRG